jgi:OOP family OmpA-OmpF porin
MNIRKVLVSSALVLSGYLAGQASAQGFVGGSLGQSDIADDITRGLITSGSVDGKDTAFKLFTGYMFDRHFGVESAYVDLGEVSYSGAFSGDLVTGGKVEVTGFNIAALGSYPASDEFSLFGKIGLFIWEWRATDTTAGAPFSTKDHGTDISFGLGVGYNFTRSLGVRAEWERFRLDDADADLLSIGIIWRL